MILGLQWIDAILLILLIGFVAWGFANGFIRALGGIIGIIVAGALASRYYLILASFITPYVGGNVSVAALISFSVLFLLIGRLFGLVVWLFQKAFDIIAFIPFLKSINRVIGALFGLILGILLTGTILYVASKYSAIWPPFNAMVSHSFVSQFVLKYSKLVQVFFPQDLLGLKSYF